MILKQFFLMLLYTLVWISSGQSKEPDYLNLLDKSIFVEYATMEMEIYKNNNMIKYYNIESFRQGERLRMEFKEPATERGRKILSDELNLWMYLPRTSKIMKLPFKQSFMGSDASNRDLMRMAFKKDYTISNNTVKDKNILILELKAKNSNISYDKMVVTMDKVKMVPLKQEIYSLSGKLIKTLIYENIVLVDGTYMASTLTINDEIQKDTKTKLIYSQMKRKNDKPKEFFTLASIKK